MKYDLLIVGNGFDLNCKCKTSYNDFLNWCGSKGYSNPLISFFDSARGYNFIDNDDWNSFEKMFCQYLQFINLIFNSKEAPIESYFDDEYEDYLGNKRFRYFKFVIKDLSSLPLNIYRILCLRNPLQKVMSFSTGDYYYSDLCLEKERIIPERVFGRVYVEFPFVEASKENVLKLLIDKLLFSFNDLERQLSIYINEVTKDITTIPTLLTNIEVGRILTFNYSSVAQRAFNLDDNSVFHVHGKATGEIVLGVEESMIEKQQFDEKGPFLVFFKRFRRLYKGFVRGYNDTIDNSLNKDSAVAIFGHSLDLSDKSILTTIFKNYYKSYDIYCYKDYKPYIKKLVNLIGLSLYEHLDRNNKIKYIVVN